MAQREGIQVEHVTNVQFRWRVNPDHAFLFGPRDASLVQHHSRQLNQEVSMVQGIKAGELSKCIQTYLQSAFKGTDFLVDYQIMNVPVASSFGDDNTDTLSVVLTVSSLKLMLSETLPLNVTSQ